MRNLHAVVCLLCVADAVFGQAPTGPVVNPRGVINAFTQQPAPTTVAPGGIIWINGLNLGPPEGVKASGSPLPTRLAEPAIEVMINNRPAPLFSANPARIVAQVPFETPPGVAQVVVRRGEQQSRPARFFVNMPVPALRTSNEKGFGEAAGALANQFFTVAASGLGETDPRVATGEAGPADPLATPRRNVRVYVGGLEASATTVLSPARVGEFDVKIEIPPQTQPGDVISLLVTGGAANRATYQNAGAGLDIKYVPLPEGTPELFDLTSSDLRGYYLVASGDRDDQGCYPSFLVDVSQSKMTPVDGCLTTLNPNANTPFVRANNGNALAALAGPPQGDAQSGISSTVKIFNPAGAGAITAQLPSPAANLMSGAEGDFVAVLPGTPARRVSIDAATGEVGELQGPAGGAPGGGGGTVGVIPSLQIDLGNGLTHVLSAPVGIGQGTSVVMVGDDANQPKKAKLALLNGQGQVTGSRDFPEGWAPLVAPRAPAGPGQPPGAQDVLARIPRVALNLDAQTRALFVVSRKTDDSAHGLAAFGIAGDTSAKAVPFPDGWFVAACTQNLQIFNLELSRRLAFLGANTVDMQFKNPCPAQGFVVMDLATQNMTAVPLPGQGQFNAAAGSSGDVNDYLYGTNTDPARRGIADTLYVLDGVTLSAFRVDLPAGIQSFAALRPIPALGQLEALGVNRAAGDAGIVMFDLESADKRVLPTPEGFAAIQLVDIFTTTRKLVARGTKAGNTGSQLLIYDLITGDLAIVPNPPDAAWVGDVPRQQPAPGGGQQQQGPPNLLRANPKANTVEAVCYNADRKQVGVLVVRIP